MHVLIEVPCGALEVRDEDVEGGGHEAGETHEAHVVRQAYVSHAHLHIANETTRGAPVLWWHVPCHRPSFADQQRNEFDEH